MEINQAEINPFDMDAMRANLPQKRGLSRCYSGKARSFVCMADVRSVEDLKKQEHPENKKKKKCYMNVNVNMNMNMNMEEMQRQVPLPPYSCRRVSSTNHFPTLYVH